LVSSNPSRWNLGALLVALVALFVAGCGTGVPLVGNDDAGVVISFDKPQSDIEGDINYDGVNDFVPGELPEVPLVTDAAQGCEDSDLDGFGRGTTCRGVDCNDHDPRITNQCYEGCFYPDVREGCACSPGAQPLPCDLATGRSSGVDGVCNPGQRTCSPNRNGTTWSWGACERWRPDYPGARYVGPISACPGSCLPTCRRQIICPTATDPAASALPAGSSGVGIGLGTPAVFCPTGTPNGGVTSTCAPVTGTAYTRGVTPASVPWVDACAAPGHLTYLTGTDDGYVSSTLPFAFQFYGSAESTIGISSNGILSFPDTPALTNYVNTTLPYATIPNAIFPFWDDLMTRSTGICVTATGSAPTRQHVVQWADGHFCCTNDPTVHMDFEVLLSEGTHIIDVRYNRMDDPSGRASGSSATIGIQQGTGVRYDLVSYDTTAAVSTGSSIRWLPTASSTLCSRGVYNRVFDGNCAPTGAADRDLFTATLPFWGQFNFTSNVPTGTSIQFEVRAADTTAGLTSATPVRLSDAPSGVTSAPVSIDLRAALRAASTPGNELWNRRYLQVTAYLNPSADGGTAPTLISTETQYTCLPRELDVPCRAGGSCLHPTPCHAGVIACVTTPGAARPREVCTDGGVLPAGTTCGTGMVCNPSGACVPCAEGGTCSPTTADPGCATGRVSCATGLPVCNATLYPAGTPCGSMGSTDYIRTATAAPWRDVCALPGHTTHLTSTDDGAALEPLPFPFRYYSTAVSSIGISSNGMLQFGGLAGLTAYTNGPLPNGSTPDTLFAFWDDLMTRGVGICTATVGLAPNRTHVVQWSDLHYCCTDDPAVHLNFEVALNEGTNTVDVLYGTMTGGGTRASGDNATVGLQEGTGSRYQQLSYNTAGSVMSNSSYRWTPSGGMVCNTMGRCVSCTDRTPCSPTGNPCDTGITVCTSGVPTCAMTGRLTPGTSCGTDQVCNPSGSCIPCREGAACSTGVTCEIGAVSCTTGVPTCRRVGYEPINTTCVVSGGPGRCDGMSTCVPCGATELCDGIDNDCDGMVDESLTRACYSGAAGTSGVGICRPGTQSCVSAAWGRCAGEVTPAAERCNATDDDCDGAVDEDFLGGVAAAPASPRVLVYQPGEGSTAPAYPAGSVITRVTDAAWRSMTTAQFATYNLIVLGSGCTYSSCQAVFDTRNTWAPAVGGRVVVETSHALEHGQYNGPRAWLNWIIRGNGTGLYVADDESTRNLDYMAPFGTFVSRFVNYDPGNIVMPGHAAMAGVTNGDLTMSNNHSSMTSWPSGFVVLARPGPYPAEAMVVARDTGAELHRGRGRVRPHRHLRLHRRRLGHRVQRHRGHAFDRGVRRRRQRLRRDGRRGPDALVLRRHRGHRGRRRLPRGHRDLRGGRVDRLRRRGAALRGDLRQRRQRLRRHGRRVADARVLHGRGGDVGRGHLPAGDADLLGRLVGLDVPRRGGAAHRALRLARRQLQRHGGRPVPRRGRRGAELAAGAGVRAGRGQHGVGVPRGLGGDAGDGRGVALDDARAVRDLQRDRDRVGVHLLGLPGRLRHAQHLGSGGGRARGGGDLARARARPVQRPAGVVQLDRPRQRHRPLRLGRRVDPQPRLHVAVRVLRLAVGRVRPGQHRDGGPPGDGGRDQRRPHDEQQPLVDDVVALGLRRARAPRALPRGGDGRRARHRRLRPHRHLRLRARRHGHHLLGHRGPAERRGLRQRRQRLRRDDRRGRHA